MGPFVSDGKRSEVGTSTEGGRNEPGIRLPWFVAGFANGDLPRIAENVLSVSVR
jgi:hypothetical protein